MVVKVDKISNKSDLIKTIEDDIEPEDMSEDSEAEIEVSTKHNLTFFLFEKKNMRLIQNAFSINQQN